MSAIAVLLKNTPTFSRTARRYSSQHSATAAAMPIAAPTSGAGRLPGRLRRRPQEQRGLQALAADREERGERQRPGADASGALHLAAQVSRQAGRGAPHPEDHRR